jgi:signal transduction histidine kinase
MRALRGETVAGMDVHVYRLDSGEPAYIANANARPYFNERGEVEQVVLTVRDITQTRVKDDALIRQAELRRAADGRPTEVLESNTDITARVAAEQALRKLTAEFEQQVERRTHKLSELNDELQEFVHTIAHDLRAPLRGISGFAHALFEDEGARLSDVGRQHTQRIVSAARRMDSLIQDLLVYSRLARATISLVATSIDAVLALVLHDLDAEIHARKARISVQPEMPEVLAHPGMLQQALAQLLDNALKFVAPGSAPEIAITASVHGSCVRVTISDNGIAVSPQYHKRIFLPFERLHGEDSYAGTGIGLAIVRRALSRMGGRVGVESSGTAGARFWFELEAANAHA